MPQAKIGIIGGSGLYEIEGLADIEEVSLSGWRRAVEKYQLDTDFYVNQAWDATQRLPWEIIESGAKLDYPEREISEAFSIAPAPNQRR